jgi:hypothetical protein
MLRGESLEDCLLRYPDHAEELEPLLRIVADTREVSRTIEPRPEFKARLRYQTQSRIADKNRRAKDRYMTVGWLPRWATMTVISLLMLVFAAGSVYAVSADTVPGDLLYPVKRAGEQVQMFFTFSNEGKAELHAMFASRRVEEIESIAPEADATTVDKLSSDFESNMQKVCELAAAIGEEDEDAEEDLQKLKQTVLDNFDKDASAIASAEMSAPAETRDDIATAKVEMDETYTGVVEAINSAAAATNPTPTPTTTTNASASVPES